MSTTTLLAEAREMVAIIRSSDSDDDERAIALHTLQQIFFPELDDCSATLEPIHNRLWHRFSTGEFAFVG